MRKLAQRVDYLLRGDASPTSSRTLAVILILAGSTYGLAMGAYAGGGSGRQMLYSAVKVPFLLLAAFALSVPSFFVVNTLLGLRDDFRASFRALVSAQAALTVILASLAPFTLLAYVSGIEYRSAILFNAAMFTVAAVSAQRIIHRAYQPLIRKHPRHRHTLRAWLFIYAFVGIQMGWVLRPFIGDPKLATTFLRPNAWSNAYVNVAGMIRSKIP